MKTYPLENLQLLVENYFRKHKGNTTSAEMSGEVHTDWRVLKLLEMFSFEADVAQEILRSTKNLQAAIDLAMEMENGDDVLKKSGNPWGE